MIVFFSHNISNKAMKEFCEDQIEVELLGYPAASVFSVRPL